MRGDVLVANRGAEGTFSTPWGVWRFGAHDTFFMEVML